MKHRLICRTTLLVLIMPMILILPSCKKNKVVTIKTLLMEMTDRNAITRFPQPYYNLKQFSSYDRKSVTPSDSGWFANDDYTQFIGIDSSKGRKEYILFDTDGPGSIVRWWMTFAGEGGLKGTIRLYVDNEASPVFESDPLKLFNGNILAGAPLATSVSPETEIERRGQNLYLPIPYKVHCRITYECDAISITENSRKPNIYYNICYRAYEPGTKVVSFSMEELKHASELIAATNNILLKADSTAVALKNKKYTLEKTLNAGDSASLVIDSKNSAIRLISLKISAFDTDQALRSTVLSIDFDGHGTVWVPSGYFFGTGSKESFSSTWYSMVDGKNIMESYWVMPFREKCTISILNHGDREIKAELKAIASGYNWNENSMYFGASWHEYHQILTAGAKVAGGTGMHRDINYSDIKGNGVYAGDAVTVFNTVDSWWGEGDEKIFVDSEAFPSSIGTGTEDYYGYAWCRPELFTHPFIAQPSGSGNFHPGLSINMRYRNLDAIPFRSSISSNIELWHWLPAVINYGLTTYFYVRQPYEINIKPDLKEVQRPVPIDPERPL
ncbi:MAG TPA: glycoside hydrolase family 172 protein [Bacteroidales bacterium]|nr:glycoside hydrolase family 172 protein [Bacteroidales bacterium]